MPEQFITPPQDDEIVISLVEQKMVIHDTVRINATVVVQKPDDMTEEQLRTGVRDVLRRFMKADWGFTDISRSRGHSRFEQVQVQAITRVSEAENNILKERADAVSTPAIQITRPVVEYALPFDKVQEINRDLRVALYARAIAECALYNKACDDGKYYRVASVEYGDTPNQDADRMRAGKAYAASVSNSSRDTYAHPGSGGGSAFDAEEGSADFRKIERFWVAAVVTLRRKP